MPRRKRVSDADLLDALRPTVLAEGPDGVTLPQLAEIAGLSPATLLQRFGSKVELIEAVIDRHTASIVAQLDRPRSPTEDPRLELARWLATLTAGTGDRRVLVGSFQILARDMTVPARNRKARRYLKAVRTEITRALERCGAPKARASALAPLVEAHWHGLVIQWGLGGRGSLTAWVKRGVAELLSELVP